MRFVKRFVRGVVTYTDLLRGCQGFVKGLSGVISRVVGVSCQGVVRGTKIIVKMSAN